MLALYNTPAMRFTKYHGAGNDFLIVEADGGAADWPALALAMCERHTGVGADGLLVVEASDKAAHRMVLFNADGSEAEMSGNGIRCFAKHVIEELGAPRDLLTIETLAGLHEITPSIRERAGRRGPRRHGRAALRPGADTGDGARRRAGDRLPPSGGRGQPADHEPLDGQSPRRRFHRRAG